MKSRSVSSRWSAAVVMAVLGAALVPALSVTSADGAGRCAVGAEAPGCKLPDEARFYKKLSGSAAITVQVSANGISLTAYAAPIKCTKFEPNLGSESYVAVGMSDKRHPKVGGTYVLKERETQRGEEGEGTSTTVTEVTLSFKSAQLAVVKMHQVSETDGKVGCDGGATWNVKRQS